MIFRHHSPSLGVLVVGIISGTAGMLAPGSLRQPYRIWMAAGDMLGWINSKIILGLLFYIVVTPLRILMTLVGSDPMTRNFDPKADTYRVVRKPRNVSHMTHQF